jgi:hypothetical protein
LELLLELPLRVLVTGHREVRFDGSAREWIELTLKAINAVGEELLKYGPEADFMASAREIFITLSKERNISESVIEKRMTPLGSSSFDNFDLPGIKYYWETARGNVGL